MNLGKETSEAIAAIDGFGTMLDNACANGSLELADLAYVPAEVIAIVNGMIGANKIVAECSSVAAAQEAIAALIGAATHVALSVTMLISILKAKA